MNSEFPKILFIDVETFPNIAYVWGKYEQNVIRFKQQTCIATFAAKWLNKPVFAKGLPDYTGYKSYSYDDSKIINDIWKLFDEADIIVAHNGASFDVKVCQARFLFYGLKPPSPFKLIDTKLAVKKVAKFNSAKLDDLGEILGFGRKIKTDFDLWEGCIQGNDKSWKEMVSYNKKDILLLEKLYIRLLPWIGNHPNVTVYDDRAFCPKCGSADINYRGVVVTTTCKYRKFQCQDCGGWGRDTKNAGKTNVTNAQSANV